MLANVSAEQLMLAKGFVAFVLTIATELVCFAVSGAPWSLAGWYLLLGSVGAVPVILVSLVVGLASRDQMTAGLYSVPVLLLTMAPIFGSFSEGIRAVVCFAPTPGRQRHLHAVRTGGAPAGDRGLDHRGSRRLQAALPTPPPRQLALLPTKSRAQTSHHSL